MGEKLMPIEVHFEKRIMNSNVVREADAKSHRDYIVVTVLASVFLFGLFAYAWQHYQWIQYGYRIEEAQKKKEQLSETSRQLHLEKATLSNPRRIDALARRDLGMVFPQPGQLVNPTDVLPQVEPLPQSDQPGRLQQTEIQAQPASLTAKR
jgi:cell division protein FtsL